MMLLVVDTALGACSVGVFRDGVEIAGRSEMMGRGHQERLGGLAQQVLVEAGAAVGDIQRIGVTVGPGSFTGLRVGMAFASGLGLAWDRPVVGVGALDGLAASVGADDGRALPGLTAAVIDARRDQFYLRLFRAGLPLTAPAAVSPDEAAATVAGLLAGDEPLTLVGSGAPALEALLAGPPARVEPLAAPTLAALARLTQAAPADAVARPLYLRPPDAKPPQPKAVLGADQ